MISLVTACIELLRRRRERNLTQTDVADRAGVHITTVCRLERGTYRRGPDVDTLRRLAGALDTTAGELFPELLGTSESSPAA